VICGNVDGAPIVNLQKPWNRVRRKAGIPDCHIHDLRHSFASMAAASGASLPMIGKLLGHAHPQTTARYAHLADDPIHQLNANVAGAIADALTGK
jgi:integrase